MPASLIRVQQTCFAMSRRCELAGCNKWAFPSWFAVLLSSRSTCNPNAKMLKSSAVASACLVAAVGVWYVWKQGGPDDDDDIEAFLHQRHELTHYDQITTNDEYMRYCQVIDLLLYPLFTISVYRAETLLLGLPSNITRSWPRSCERLLLRT